MPVGARVAGDVSVWRAPPFERKSWALGPPPALACLLWVARYAHRKDGSVGYPQLCQARFLACPGGVPPWGDSSFQDGLAPCGLGARGIRILLPDPRVVPGASLPVSYFSGPLGRVAHSSSALI